MQLLSSQWSYPFSTREGARQGHFGQIKTLSETSNFTWLSDRQRVGPTNPGLSLVFHVSFHHLCTAARTSSVQGMFATECFLFLEGRHAAYPNLSEAFPIQNMWHQFGLDQQALSMKKQQTEMVFGRRWQLSIELVEFHPLMNLIVVGSFFFMGW